MICKISSLKSNNYKNQNRISFGSMNYYVYKDKEKTILDYNVTTSLLRNDLNWDMLTEHILKDNKPKKIYCYACADGSEAYSIAMQLIAKLGWEKAQKYFPIIAKDIDSYALKRAKSCYIDLSHLDVYNLNFLQNLSKMKFMDIVKPAKRHGEYSVFRVDDKLKSCVIFSKGDLSEDATKLTYKDSIIFFRNVWPYLSNDKINSILKTFSEKFEPETSLVIGSFDINNPTFDDRLKYDFKNLLYINNLWQVKPMIYQTHNLKNKDTVSPSKVSKIITNAVTEKYHNVLDLFKTFITD